MLLLGRRRWWSIRVPPAAVASWRWTSRARGSSSRSHFMRILRLSVGHGSERAGLSPSVRSTRSSSRTDAAPACRPVPVPTMAAAVDPVRRPGPGLLAERHLLPHGDARGHDAGLITGVGGGTRPPQPAIEHRALHGRAECANEMAGQAKRGVRADRVTLGQRASLRSFRPASHP
jgi:hypothetical protein